MGINSEEEMDKPKLYEVDHPYYCAEEGYYYNASQVTGWGAPMEFGSIPDYLEEWAGADADMNFIFRWDWKLMDAETYKEEYCGDLDPERDEVNSTGEYSQITIFYMMQRKGCKKVITINGAEKEHEPLLRAHLERAWKRMIQTWEGIS